MKTWASTLEQKEWEISLLTERKRMKKECINVKENEEPKQSTGRRVVVRVWAVLLMYRMGRAVISQEAIELMPMKNVIELLREGIIRVCRSINLEKPHQALTNLFLCCKKLEVHMASATAGPAMVCNDNCALIFLTHGGKTGEREAEVKEQLPKIRYVLAGITTSHSLGFCL
jgi:hypothetical protein